MYKISRNWLTKAKYKTVPTTFSTLNSKLHSWYLNYQSQQVKSKKQHRKATTVFFPWKTTYYQNMNNVRFLVRFTTSIKASFPCDCEYYNRFTFTVRFWNTSSLKGTLTSDTSIGENKSSDWFWAYQWHCWYCNLFLISKIAELRRLWSVRKYFSVKTLIL